MTHRNWLIALGIWIAVAATAWAGPPWKALIVDGQNNHDWKGTTPVLKKELEETGLFTVDVATSPARGQDLSGFRPDFAAYQVVVSNYNGDLWPAATQKALVDYVSGGGGLVVVHAADNSFGQWKEYNEMIAVGGWGGQSGPYIRWREGKMALENTPGPAGSHGAYHPFPLVVRDAEHPVTKGLPPVFLHASDELYNRLRGPAKNVSLLATAFSPKDKGGSGEIEPILMAIDYGKGRVFHTTLGHDARSMKCVAFTVTFQRGTEWAATGKVTQKVPADFPTADHVSTRP